jgi:hypothetical protein
MAAEINQIDPQDFMSQTYEGQDVNLLTSFDVNTFLSSSSYIELFIYDNNKNILTSNLNFTQYTVQNNGQSAANGNNISEIILDPEKILIDNGFDQGEYTTYFNFFNQQIGSDLESLYISEISSDRTELRLDSTALTNLDIVEQTLKFIQERENSPYFLDFYINFGENQLLIANNIQLDNTDENNPTVLVKLYEPLPEEFGLNSTLWAVTVVEEPRAYQVTFEDIPIIISDTAPLKGPNFNLDLKDRVNNSTLSLSYTDLISSPLTSSQQQLNSFLEEKEIDINIDYTNFSDFIHFSSAKTRIENFYYKVQLIEQYSSSISILGNTTNNDPSSSIAIYQSKIDNIITNFDGYDYYLYYSSGSWAYPKANPEPPYSLYPTNSPTVLSWLGSDNPNNLYYGGVILSASVYDQNNKDNLYFVIPEYIKEDSDNDPYLLFIDMVGQHYDNIWIYYKDVTQKYNADNRLEYGISKDVVADAIRDFGVKLYQNNFSTQDLYTAFLGLTPDGALFPFPNITGSLPTPSGFEYVDTLISASNDYMPLDDVNKSLYKRIYHNLPYLLKSKGTLPGLRALITSYGIPDTILRINEYGGKDKVQNNDWDWWQNEFNYAFCTTDNNFISSSWSLNTDWNSPDDVPSTLMFRFKTDGLPQTNIPYSQSLWYATDGLSDSGSSLTLTYTGSAYFSGSYSGSIIDPYYQFAHLTFYPDTGNSLVSASVYLPFFDGGWWSVMVNRSGSNFTLYTGNKIYEGGDNGTQIGFFASSSISSPSTNWIGALTSYFPVSFSISSSGGTYDVGFYDVAVYDNISGVSSIYTPFSGCYQEIRYYSKEIGETTFKNYLMNPYSIEGNSFLSSPDELAFRAAAAGELYQGNISIHPKVTGSWITTQSFASDSTFFYDSTPEYFPNTEYFFLNQPIIGIKNIVSDKIRLENDSLPSGNTLSPFRPLAQTTEASASYTPNINYLEVSFSPQNEINEDIVAQLGYFNIGEYIGDPAFRFSPLQSYPELNSIRDYYFEKYIKNYDLVDFIRLMKFFDNSLFKMIKDFVPARTSLASGVVIKQHLLERNRYPQPIVSWEDLDISGTLKPTWNGYNPGTVENFSGGTGGSFEMFNGTFTSPSGSEGLGPNNIFGITQSWYETYQTVSGSVTVLHDSQDEFYDGEFSGSVILVTTQSLSQPYPLENTSFGYRQVYYYGTGSAENDIFENLYLNNLTSPENGEILFFERFIGPTIYGTAAFPKYLKIAKIDCNGNNNATPLGQITSVLVNTFISLYPVNIWIEYGVTPLSEQPDYYLYQISSYKYNGQNIFYGSNIYENQVLNYYVSASKNTLTSFSPSNFPITDYTAELGNTLGYFDSTLGTYTLGNTPNTPISLTASFNISQSGAGSAGTCSISVNSGGNISYIASTSFPSSFTGTRTISASYYALSEDILVLTNKGGSDVNLTGVNWVITQSRAVSSSICNPIILDPYITNVNFYNSDQNAVINNVDTERLSTIYQDVDYTPGILTPTNFNFLISGSATKAAVQDSNYTAKRHIIPRYEGSKSTSQKLNKWTRGDIGTYGKIPTIDSTKVYAAYCDFIGGWPPERMNSSGAHIIYLIKDDGTVVIPGTSENSLGINKGTFESGERITISSKNIPTGEELPYRTIIRGGTRIEPILYTQSGSAPNAQWDNTINFQDITLSTSGSVGNYLATYNKTSTQLVAALSNPSIVVFNNTVNGIPVVSNGYQIPLNAVDDGVSIVLTATVRFAAANSVFSPNASTKTLLQFAKNGNFIPNSAQEFTDAVATVDPINYPDVFSHTISYTIPNAELAAGDIYTLTIQRTNQQVTTYNIQIAGTNFKITQQPSPTSPVTSSGYNSIWGYVDTTNYPYVITSSQPTLVDLYGDPNVKMSNITGSGFNSITLPWSIKYGDEFRFEGREDFVYQVGKIFSPSYSGSDRITQTGSIEVHFDKDLPVSASSAVFNLDHFLIRRYVDDPSLILFEGLKPTGAEGPYIIKPEFVNEKLNKSIDEYITDLTQKGLL